VNPRRAETRPPTDRPVVLVVDDDESVRQVIEIRLKRKGFHPLLAADPETARQHLASHFVSLAIVDLRLRDPANPADRSGLDFALELTQILIRGLPVIILTAYPDLEMIKEALHQTIAGLPVNVVGKQDGSRWIEAVEWAADRSPINVSLDIDHKRLRQLTRQLETDRQQRGAKRLTAHEIEDLLRRLFRTRKTALRLRQLLPGRSGSGIVLVEPSYEEDIAGAMLVVKYSERQHIEREAENYERFVEPYILPRATIRIGSPVYTRDWGAMKFVFIGAPTATPRDFATFFEDERTTLKQLRDTVSEVFDECCRAWYRGVRTPPADEPGLRNTYSDTLELEDREHQHRLDQAAHEILAGQARLAARFTRGEYGIAVDFGKSKVELLPDPVAYFRDPHSYFPAPRLIAITHGDLHVRNILVNAEGHPWLIDFFRTGWGHAFRDFAELESVVKFELLDHGENLRNILMFEAALVRAICLDRTPAPTPFAKAFQRPLAVVREIRKQAGIAIGDREAMSEYRAALFFYAIKELTRRPVDNPVVRFNRRAHALYSAALIASYLRR